MAETERTCGQAGGVNAKGEPCSSTLGLGATGLCVVHDPARADKAAATRSAGGRAAAAKKREAATARPADCPAAPRTLADAVRWSSWAMLAVATGDIDARTGHEIGYLVNAFKAAVEKRDLERQIEELRAELAEARKRPRAA